MTEPRQSGLDGAVGPGGPDGAENAGGRRSRYARPLPPPPGAATVGLTAGSAAEARTIAAHQPLLPHEPVRRTQSGPRRRALAVAARIGGPPATLAVVATIGLVLALATLEGSRSLAVNTWLLAIGGLVVITFWRALARALPPASASAFDTVRRRTPEPPSKLHDVIAIEGVLLDAEWSRGGVEYRLRPLFRKIAAARLIEHHQIDLAAEPEAARRIVGDTLWALVGPEAGSSATAAGESPAETAPPEAAGLSADPSTTHTEWTKTRRGRHGIPRATIRRAIEQLEAL